VVTSSINVDFKTFAMFEYFYQKIKPVLLVTHVLSTRLLISLFLVVSLGL